MIGAHRVEQLECVLGTRELGIRHRLTSHRLQGGDKCPRLLHPDQGVVAAVQNEHGRSLVRDMLQRRRGLPQRPVLLQGALHHPIGNHALHGHLRADEIAIEKIIDAVEGHGRLHAGIHILEFRLPLGAIGSQRGQRAQVPAGRTAGDGNKIRIAAVFRDILPDPGNGFFHIDDVSGKCGLRAETVIDGHAQPAPLGHMVHERQRLLLFLANHPGAPMHLQQHRESALAPAVGMVNVQQVALAGTGVADIAVPAHTLALEAERFQPVAAEDIVAQQRLPLSGNRRAVTLAQGAPQAGLEVMGAVHGLAVDVQQAQPGQGENAHAGLRQRLAQPSGNRDQDGERKLPPQVNQGELATQPGGEKIQGHQPVQPAGLHQRTDRAGQAHYRERKIHTGQAHQNLLWHIGLGTCLHPQAPLRKLTTP